MMKMLFAAMLAAGSVAISPSNDQNLWMSLGEVV